MPQVEIKGGINLTENNGNTQDFELYYEQNHERILKELKAALRFQSVSSDVRFHGQVEACGEWYIEHLENMGFTAQFFKTDSLPLVYAERPGRESLPTILLYGHIDVQPTGDPDDWVFPPFEPHVREGRLYARGSRDNKGQTFFWLKAFEALSSMGLLHNPVKILLDTEEESLSPGLIGNIYHYADRLSADVIVASETPGCNSGDPAIVLGLRGAVYLQIRAQTAKQEVHSGNHGGVVRNPIIELSKVLGSLVDEDNKVNIPGFYNEVVEPSDLERRLINNQPFSEQVYIDEFGIKEIRTEPGYTALEQIGFRPSLDISGIEGGSRGRQIKTSIPTHADASIAIRLVQNQNPQKIMQRVVAHIKNQLPESMSLEVLQHRALAPPFRADLKSPYYKIANQALGGIASKEVLYSWSGASLPVIPMLVEISGAEPLLIGFGLNEDNEHGVDESFSLEQFKKGFMFACKFINSLYDKL